MKLSDLFEELSRREFQNPETGNMFFPAYIYCYDPQEEYQIRKEIIELKDRLIRPDIFQECMVTNIYEEFCKKTIISITYDEGCSWFIFIFPKIFHRFFNVTFITNLS